MEKLRLAIIGCGQVTEAYHLPVIVHAPQFEVVALVDKFLPRAQQLADQFNVPIVVDDYREIIERADVAIVALPHHLHAPVTLNLLQNGIHVLVEKPMALSVSDCDAMINAANEARVALAVGLVRRFYLATQFVKQIIQGGLLGDITGFDFREGTIYAWDVASDFMFRKQAGGGVLADTGVHVLDTLLWWLGDCKQVEYYDDAMGGVEADCEIHLELESGPTGLVELSRTRRLRNTYIIQGTRGTLEIGAGFNPTIKLNAKGQTLALNGHAMLGNTVQKALEDVFLAQLNDLAEAIQNEHPPLISGHEGRRSVELIETCYALRQSLVYPWALTSED